MSSTAAPSIQLYYVSRIGRVVSAMFPADQGLDHGGVRLYETLDEAQAAFEAQKAAR